MKGTPLWKALLLEHRVPWRYRDKLNRFLLRNLFILNLFNGKINITNSYNGLGDQLLLTCLASNIKKRYPRIKINCIVKNKELMYDNPDVYSTESYSRNIEDYSSYKKIKYLEPILFFEYDKMMRRKDPNINIMRSSFNKVGIKRYEFTPRFFLSKQEEMWANEKLKNIKKPIIVFSTRTKQKAKDWIPKNWQKLINLLKDSYCFVHIGDRNELNLNNVVRFASMLSVRESISILSKAKLYIGGVGFLMHAAKSVNIPSIIMYGGRETPLNSGYNNNQNIYIKIECSPCWVHNSSECPINLKCMSLIKPDIIKEKVREMIK